MSEELFEKVKKRTDKRLEQYESSEQDGAPFNNAIDHLGRIEGYPTQNLSKVNINNFPLPIRILGYLLISTLGIGALIVIILVLVNK